MCGLSGQCVSPAWDTLVSYLAVCESAWDSKCVYRDRPSIFHIAEHGINYLYFCMTYMSRLKTTPHHTTPQQQRGQSRGIPSPHPFCWESLSKQGWEGSLPFLLSRSHNAELLWCRWPPGGRQRPDTGTTCGSPTVYHVGILKTAAAISLLIREFDFSIVCSFQWRWKSLPFWRGLTMWRETVTKVKS